MLHIIATKTKRAQTIIAVISQTVNFLPIYQVLFLFLPNPLSSMAFETVSILLMLERIRGTRIALVLLSLLSIEAFLLISIPLACCAWDIS